MPRWDFLSGPNGRGGRSPIVHFRWTPDPRPTPDDDPDVRRRRVEVALRTVHARGLPFAVDLRVRPDRPPRWGWAMPPRLVPWFRHVMVPALATGQATHERWAPPLERLDRALVGIARPRPGVAGPATPLHALEPSQAPALLDGLASSLEGSDQRVWVRWTCRPVGATRPAELAMGTDVPRQHPTVLVNAAPRDRHAREMEVRGHVRSFGPLWASAAWIFVWGGGPAQDGRSDLEGLVGGLSAWDGARGWGVRWLAATPAKRRALARALELQPRPVGLGIRPPATLTADEMLPWFPPSCETPRAAFREGAGAPRLSLGRDRSDGDLTLAWDPAQGHHLLVVGESGTGKSSLLQSLAGQLTAAHGSFWAIDPSGETLEGLQLGPSSPPWGPLTALSPTCAPLGLNLLAPPQAGEEPPGGRERRVGEVVSALRGVRAERFGGTFYWGPRLEDVLTRALLVVSVRAEGTLVDAWELLGDPAGYAAAHPGARGTTPLSSLLADPEEDRAGARRLLQEVALTPALRQMTSTPSPSWSLRAGLSPGAVTLVRTDRKEVGIRASSYLGSALLSALWSQILQRPRPEPVVLLLDEVQEYGCQALVEMLRIGRRHGVHVWAATQSLASLGDELRDALLTNCRDLLMFRGAPGDARLAKDYLGLDDPALLLALPKGEAVAFLGKSAHPQHLRTPRPTDLPCGSRTWELALASSGGAEDRATVEEGGSSTAPPVAGAAGDPILSHLQTLARRAGASDVVACHPAEIPNSDAAALRRWGARLRQAGALRSIAGRGCERTWYLDARRLRDWPDPPSPGIPGPPPEGSSLPPSH